ncbi:MAG: peptide chain release factor N(5)-glutamine methyltransferase [Acidimicrobiia bacterium]
MTPDTTWRDLLREACDRLGVEHEARRLIERASGYEGPDYVLALDEPARERSIPFFRDMLERRASGEPLQYVLGRWGFRKLDLFVDRRVLIPRPETEQVVEHALAEARRLARPLVTVDLGTGSGAIALSLALELGPEVEVWATDRSADALAVARANLTGIGSFAAQRVRLVEGDWFAALPEEMRGHIGLIVSNPPYVGASEELPGEVRDWEPEGALVAGPGGLEDVERIVSAAPSWLTAPGALVVEIAPHQAEGASTLARAAGFDDVDVLPDLSGRLRALVARVSP